MQTDTDVIIIGAGVGGLVLALSLHQAGIGCRVFEAVAEIQPLGVGINLLPHAARELDELGLLPALDALGVHTKESIFFTRHGQFIYSEPAGKAAGYDWPQYSIHRGDLQMALLAAARERLGAGSVATDSRRSEEHTSELQSLMRISYAVFCLKKKNTQKRGETQTKAN